MNTEQPRVGATNISSVFEAKVRENFAAIVGEIAPKNLEHVVRGLEEHFLKGPPDKLGQCDLCLGWSPVEDLEACPYCDDTGGEAAAIPAEVVDSFPETAIDATKMNISSVGKTVDTHLGKGKVVFEIESAVNDERPLAERVVEVRAEEAGKRKKLTGAEVAEKKAITKAPPLPKPSAPAGFLAAGGRIATEKELDESLARYRAASEQGADSLYLMGLEIRRQRDHLWQQRRLEDGKPKYKTWNQFVLGEHEISVSLANRTMRVVENFSQAQFHEYGAKALMVLVGAPKEEHAALLAQADSGATTRELEESVRQIRERDGITAIETDRSTAAAATGRKIPTVAAAKARKKDSAAITVGLKTEQGTVKLLSRKAPDGQYPAGKKEEERAARTIEDGPYGTLECINGVTLYFAVKQRPTGELELKWTAKRDDSEG